MLLIILKKYWREALIALLLIVMGFISKSCSEEQANNDLLKNSLDSAYNVAKAYTTKNGELAYQVKTHEITIDQLKDNNEVLGIDNKKLKKQIGSLNNLVGYWKGKASVKDTFTVNNVDTVFIKDGKEVKGKWFKWNNKYMSVDGITTDLNTSLTYEYKIEFELTAYRKYPNFLRIGKSELLTDITFKDPSIKVGEFKGIVIKEPKKQFWETGAFKFAIGLGAGYLLAK